MRITVVVMAWLLALTGWVQAQGAWTVFQQQDGTRGASVCPMNDPEFGAICLGLVCGPQDKVARFFFASSVGGTEAKPDFAIVTLDGVDQPGLQMVPLPGTEVMFVADPGADLTGLLAGMRTAQQGQVRLIGMGNGAPVAFVTQGAGAALDSALQMCGGAKAVAAPAAVVSANPVVDMIERHAADCSAGGGVAGTTPNLVTAVDLNADGWTDLVLDSGGLTCPPSLQMYCGNGGCDTEFWLLQPDGRYRQVYATLLQGWKMVAPATIQLSQHGSACNRSGAEGCVRDFIVGTQTFTPRN